MSGVFKSALMLLVVTLMATVCAAKRDGREEAQQKTKRLLTLQNKPPKHKWLAQLAEEEAAEDEVVKRAENARATAAAAQHQSLQAKLSQLRTSKCLYECSGRGDCNEGTGKCTCHQGSTGLGCELNLKCPADCSGHGKCKEYELMEPVEYKGERFHGKCECQDMWTDLDCNSIEHAHVQ